MIPIIKSPAVRAAEKVASEQILRIQALNGIGKIKTWDDIERNGLAVMSHWKLTPFTYDTFLQFQKEYVRSAPARMAAVEAARAAAPVEKVAFGELENIFVPLDNGISLKPRQQKCINAGVQTLFKDKSSRAIMYPLEAGEGKSFIAGAMIKYIQSVNYEGYNPPFTMLGKVLYLTKKGVVDKTKRVLLKLGVKSLNKDVLVMSYRSLSTLQYKTLFREVTVEHFGNDVTILQYGMPGLGPRYIILDESHELKKSKSVKTKYIKGLIDSNTRTIFTSATPGITLEDFSLIFLASGLKFGGEAISETNISTFLKTFGSGNPIHKPNAAALERLKKTYPHIFINPPRDPRKYKATYQLVPIDFPDESSRNFYHAAEEDWIDSVRRSGKEVSERGLVMAKFQIFRAREEMMKVKWFVDEAMTAVNNGFCSLIGICFQDTLRDIVIELTKRGVPREKISIVWGGEKEIKPEEVYSGGEFLAMLRRIQEEDPDITPSERSRFRKTVLFTQQRAKRNINKEEQIERDRYLTILKLHKQSDSERELEIERYLTGVTDYCIFTFATGGTGIDLDHQDPRSKPRDVLLTQCYYAEEYVQAAGRGYRLGTISNVRMRFPFFRGTIVSDHVVPLLSRKIGSMSALTSGQTDMVSMLEAKIEKGLIKTKEDIDEAALKGIESEEVTNDEEDEEDEE